MVDKVRSGGEKIFFIVIGLVFILGFIVSRIFPISTSSMQEKIIALSILVLLIMAMSFSFGLLKDRFEWGYGQLLILVWGIAAILGIGSTAVIIIRKGSDHAVVLPIFICSMLILFVLPYSIGRWIVQRRKSQTGSSDNQCNKQAIG